MILYLWDWGTDCILEIYVLNTDTVYYIQKIPVNILEVTEIDNKHNHLESCLQHRSHFSLFVIYVDNMLGTEAEATLNSLASLLVTKF